MTPLARCTFEHSDTECTVRIHGEIDTSNAASLEDEISSQVTNGLIGLVLDLTNVGYLDSAGIRMLFALDQRCRERQQRCTIAIADQHLVRRVLTIAGVDRTLPV
jgi:anti-anti-sigma factor